VVAAALLVAWPAGGARAITRPGIRLAVIVVVDQMRADYLERFAGFFGEE